MQLRQFPQILCSWHGKQATMLNRPAYSESFPCAEKKKNAKQIKIQAGMQKMSLGKDQSERDS